jgi:predicted O-linked N-acetylglucosamine transferase (SPINDLY family)
MTQVTIDQALQLATAHHRAGRLGDAESIYRTILAAQPDHAEALHRLGMIAAAAGHAKVAIHLVSRAIAAAPNIAEYHVDLADILHKSGQIDSAIAEYQSALALAPDNFDAHNNLGLAQQAAGRVDQAIASLETALALNPGSPEAHCNLGVALRRNGQLERAIQSYQQALLLRPGYAQACSNLGDAFIQIGQVPEAMASYRQALAAHPDFAEAHYNLANALKDLREFDQAIAAYQKALSINPAMVHAHNNLALAWVEKGDFDSAIASYRRALELDPRYAEGHYNLGNAWISKGLIDQAIDCYQRALALDPAMTGACNNLANALRSRGEPDQALTYFQRALALTPGDPAAHGNLGNAYLDKGQLDLAIASYRRALALDPHWISAHDNLLFALMFHPDTDRPSLFNESQNWNRQHAHPLKQLIRPHTNDRDPDRPLRVGYISPDLRGHPVGRFILPLLAAHDPAATEVFCYARVSTPDEITRQLRRHARAWRSIDRQSDEQIAQMIRDDNIDILVDLAMHTAGNLLMVLARKPAPVQVTYLAYAGGTALDTIDYRLTDRFLDPDPADDRYSVEKPFRLPGTYWCYEPDIQSEPAGVPPVAKTGTITFGCLNKLSKVSPRALTTWADLMNRLPDSRLMLYAHAGDHRDLLRQFMADHGINPNRLDLVGKVPRAEYFDRYHRIDIVLDPFPGAGGTTTCDALWMGVPVVTLAGKTPVGRAGVSLLSHVGHPELIAETPDDYINIAIALAADRPRLAGLHRNLREHMRCSALMDAARFARDIETAYRTMWQTWCRA